MKTKTRTKRGQAEALVVYKRFLLDLWEWATRFGEGNVVPFEDWANYNSNNGIQVYKRNDETRGGLIGSTAEGQAWTRFKRAARKHCMPVEFLSDSGGQACRFYKGTVDTVSRILDGFVHAAERDAFYARIQRDSVRYDRALAVMHRRLRTHPGQAPRPIRGKIPTWVYAAVLDHQIHQEVPCPKCGTETDLVCQVSGRYTFHLDRLYAAMTARDQLNDEEN